MNLNDMTKEELELMSYNDIAELLLKKDTKQSTLSLFTSIGKLLGMNKKQIENKIGDFFTAISTDQRFLLLEDGTWDLRANHKIADKIIVEDDEDIEEMDADDYQDTDEITSNDDIFTDDKDIQDSKITEEYKNLVIVDEEDLNSEE